MSRRKIRLRPEEEPAKREEEEIAKKVVLDYATVKSAVQTIREFEKEYNISMLDRKGVAEASAILKKYEQQDKLQHFVEDKISEKIAPIDKKINRLTDMVSTMMGQREQKPKKEKDEDFEEMHKKIEQL
jgi:hypothetical protein